MLKNLLFIGIASFLSKSFAILLPYFLPADAYNHFNQKFYLVSFLVPFIVLGFDYLFPRYRINPRYYLIPLISVFVLMIAGISLFSTFDLFLLLLMIAFVISSFISTLLLFHSDLKRYLLFSFLTFITGMVSIALSRIGFDFFVIYSLGQFFVVLAIVFIFKPGSMAIEPIATKDFFKLVIGVFLLNSTASLLFSFNKYIVSEQLPIDIANAFTYLWAILVPVLYIGNLFEKYIYARVKKGSVLTDIRTGVVLNSIAVAGYIAAVNIFINVGSFLPDSIDAGSIGSIAAVMSIGFLLLSVVHFPVNGVLLKIASVRTQKLSSLFAGGMSLVSIFVIWYLAEKDLLGLTTLVTITFGTLVAINILKGYLVWFEVNESVA